MDFTVKVSFFLIPLILFNTLDYGCTAYNFVSAIDHQTAVVGTNVVFNCTFIVDQNSDDFKFDQEPEVTLTWNVDWEAEENMSTKCGEQLGTGVADSITGRYKSSYMVSTKNEETYYYCSVIIANIKQDDAGSYGCTLTVSGNTSVSDQEVDMIRSNVTELSVVQCLSYPVGRDMPLMTIREGLLFYFICNVSGGVRNVVWLDSSNNIISLPGSGQLEHRLTARNKGDVFFCEVSPVSSSGRNVEKTICSVTPLDNCPVVTMFPSRTASVMEGASVTITCDGSGALSITKYLWFHEDKPISDNEYFDIRTSSDFSESVLNIMGANKTLNNTYFTCMVYTDSGLESNNSTMLIVFENDVGIKSTSPGQQTWPSAVGATLAVVCLVVAVTFLMVFKRQKSKPNDIEMSNKESIKTETVANGHQKNPLERTSQISDVSDDRRPSLDFLDASSGRRKSSLFRESFMDLWKGNNMDDDNISDTSSVSLPSFAAVSRSRPDLTTDFGDEFACTPPTHRSHAPLAARKSAPASLILNTNKGFEPDDKAEGNGPCEKVDEGEEDVNDTKTDNQDGVQDGNDILPEIFEFQNTEQSSKKKESLSSNKSIPIVQISGPDS